MGPEKFVRAPSVREAPRVSRVAQRQRRLATLDSSPMAWTSVFGASATCRWLLHGSRSYKQMARNRMLTSRAKSASLNLSRCSQTIKSNGHSGCPEMRGCIKSVRSESTVFLKTSHLRNCGIGGGSRLQYWNSILARKRRHTRLRGSQSILEMSANACYVSPAHPSC